MSYRTYALLRGAVMTLLLAALLFIVFGCEALTSAAAVDSADPAPELVRKVAELVGGGLSVWQAGGLAGALSLATETIGWFLRDKRYSKRPHGGPAPPAPTE